MNTTNKDTIDNKQEGGAFFKNNPLNEKKNIIKNKESRAYRILKFIDKQINQMLWFLSRYIFNSKNLNKLVKIMPLVLLVINLFLAAPVVAVAVLDFYSSYIVRWFGLQWSPVEWANDLAGGSLKHVLLIIIGVIKLVISIIMIVACCVIFFQTYELNNEYIKNHNFEFLVIITQVFFRLLPYIFLSLSLMIATGFLKVYYKRFCAADQQQTPDNGDMRLQPDAMLHNAATMNMFVLLIASIIFPILNVMMTKKMFNWLRPHIPIGLSLFDNVKLLFVGFLSFIIFTFITDSISSFISNMFEKQLSGNINQDYCDPNDPRHPDNQEGFAKAFAIIKELLSGVFFMPLIMVIVFIQSMPMCRGINMNYFTKQNTLIDLILQLVFKADSVSNKKYENLSVKEMIKQKQEDDIKNEEQQLQKKESMQNNAKKEYDVLNKKIEILNKQIKRFKDEHNNEANLSDVDKKYYQEKVTEKSNAKIKQEKKYYDAGYGLKLGKPLFNVDKASGRFKSSQELDKIFFKNKKNNVMSTNSKIDNDNYVDSSDYI